MLIEIKSRFSGKVLFSHTCEGNTIKITLEAAIEADANLADAYLAGANLADANLADAYLADANLADANLADAYLAGANLADANLADAYLADANLADANLADAYLAGANLAGANLEDANLAGANLAGATGNGREVLSFVALEYRGVYTAEFMWIGCRKHPVKTWWKDSDKEAENFTESQLEWRAKNRRWIQGMVKNNPAVKTGHEGK